VPEETRRAEREGFVRPPAADAAPPPAEGTPPLPAGWCALAGVSLPGDGIWKPAPGRLVLLHPKIGAALIEPRGQALPDGDRQLYRALGGEMLERVFAGHLPVVQVVVDRRDLRRLESLITQAFAARPRLSLRGGRAWVGLARTRLQGETVPAPAPAGSIRASGHGGLADSEAEEIPPAPGVRFSGLALFWIAVAAVVSVILAVLQALGPP